MSKPRLVHVTSSLKMGGAEQVLYTLVKHLQTQFDQTVIYFHGGPFQKKLQDLGIKTIHIRGGLCLYDPLFFYRLYRTLKELEPDVVHALLWAANIASRVCCSLLQVPCINVYHNNIDQDGFIRRMLDRLTAHMQHKVIAVSEQVKQSIVVFRPASRITVVQNGIEIAQHRSLIRRADLGIESDVFVVGAVGRLVPVKAFDLLLQAVAPIVQEYAHVRVVLIGSGQEEFKLKKLAQQLGVARSVYFLGTCNAQEYYHLFDCFVQPSAKEGVSLALLEAMHFGVPCIVMGSYFVHPVIDHGVEGFVCEPGNVIEISNRIKDVMAASDVHRSAMKNAARRRLELHFSLDAMIHKYEKIFRSCVHKNTK